MFGVRVSVRKLCMTMTFPVRYGNMVIWYGAVYIEYSIYIAYRKLELENSSVISSYLFNPVIIRKILFETVLLLKL